MIVAVVFFFFFKQKTAYEVRISDWSSDVCSSDLNGHTLRTLARLECPYPLFDGINLTWETLEGLAKHNGPVANPGWALAEIDGEIGRASCRERVCQYV